MPKKEKFSIGDKVVRVGTKTPVMLVKGKTMKGGLPYKTKENTWTCYWENPEPNWKEIIESELEHFSK